LQLLAHQASPMLLFLKQSVPLEVPVLVVSDTELVVVSVLVVPVVELRVDVDTDNVVTVVEPVVSLPVVSLPVVSLLDDEVVVNVVVAVVGFAQW
jgi:hypothetical protein